MEGITIEETIFINMISVRPKYQKNSIARKMVDMARKNFPNAKITHSSATPAGEKFNNSYKKVCQIQQNGAASAADLLYKK